MENHKYELILIKKLFNMKSFENTISANLQSEVEIFDSVA